jgi:hypothetical protein
MHIYLFTALPSPQHAQDAPLMHQDSLQYVRTTEVTNPPGPVLV